jgi:hypothetical protein
MRSRITHRIYTMRTLIEPATELQPAVRGPLPLYIQGKTIGQDPRDSRIPSGANTRAGVARSHGAGSVRFADGKGTEDKTWAMQP